MLFVPALVALAIQTSTDPLNVSIVTEDIPRFWKVFDTAKDDELESRLQHEYVDVGSPGLREFMTLKVGSVKQLADLIKQHREVYVARRERTLRMAESTRAIRAAFCAFKYFYPKAKFPPVTFVIGRFTSAGTSGTSGLMLGAEMDINDPAQAHWIVAHELIHFNQRFGDSNLRDATLAEGSADFLGELCSGGLINTEQQQFGRAHEAALWAQWRHDVDNGNKIADWIGSWGQKVPRPGDLGYFVGYRITEAYFLHAPDKRRAVRDILERQDSARFIQESGYSPK